MVNFTDQQFLAWHKALTEQKWFRWWWTFWSNYSSVLWLPILIILLSRSELWQWVYVFTVAFVIYRLLVIPVICYHHEKTRPYQRLGYKPPATILFSDVNRVRNSFPSRHTGTMAIAAMTVLLIGEPILAVVAAGITLLTAAGRAVLGYHDFWDISAGLVIGLALPLILSIWLI